MLPGTPALSGVIQSLLDNTIQADLAGTESAVSISEDAVSGRNVIVIRVRSHRLILHFTPPPGLASQPALKFACTDCRER